MFENDFIFSSDKVSMSKCLDCLKTAKNELRKKKWQMAYYIAYTGLENFCNCIMQLCAKESCITKLVYDKVKKKHFLKEQLLKYFSSVFIPKHSSQLPFCYDFELISSKQSISKAEDDFFTFEKRQKAMYVDWSYKGELLNDTNEIKEDDARRVVQLLEYFISVYDNVVYWIKNNQVSVSLKE